MKHLEPNDFVVLLDERGDDLTSESLSALIADAGDRGHPMRVRRRRSLRHGDAVIKRADRKIKLSSMVMNHQVARLVLLEQIYRAWTILRGEPYHH